MSEAVELNKLHGLGNDFLVAFVADGSPRFDPADFSRRVCDRHRGVGADGLLIARVGAEPGDWLMTLYNADGSPAEMSGNGIRCFAHAVVRRMCLDLPTTLRISTVGGLRIVKVSDDPADDPDRVQATVAMGRPGPGPSIPAGPLPATRPIGRMQTWDLGNPHLVLEVADPDQVDLAIEGPAWESLFEGGINVHFVAVTGADRVRLITWERGAGITQACGTGATATALSMHAWGATTHEVQVDMPGGSVEVALGDEPILVGPSEWIADVRVRS